MANIIFSDDAAKFLILNIIAHDPIHDYNDYNSERWIKNQKYLEQMGQMIGGMPTKTETKTLTRRKSMKNCDNNNTVFNMLDPNKKKYANFSGRNKCHPSILVSKNAREERRKIINKKRFVMNMDKSLFLEEYFDHIKNQVILNAVEFIFFNKMINPHTTITIPVSDVFLICYDDTYVDDNNEESFEKLPLDALDASLENKNSVNKSVKKTQAKIIEIIAADFYFFARYCLGIENFKDMFHLIECLNNYLLTERIKTIVNERIETGYILFDDEKDTMSQDYYAADEMNNSYSDDDDDSMNGGAKKILPTDNQKFINEINEYWNTIQNDSDFTSIFNNDDLIIGYTKYDEKRNNIINALIEICKNNGIQSKEIKYLKTNMERLYPSQLKRKPRQPSKLQDRIKEAIFFSIIDAKKKLESDQEIAAEKAEKDAAAAAKGDLTSDEKKRVDNFMKFIARFGLWSMGICMLVGLDAKQVQSGTDPLLLKEIDCLKAIADWPGMPPQLKNTDLDKRIITNFYNFYKENGSLITEETASCNTNKKYIINNAASIDNLQNKVFCPTSSIVDAMTSTCTWNMAQEYGIEAGNVDYTITSALRRFSYQGKTTFIQEPTTNSGTIVPIVSGLSNFIESKLIVTLPNGIVIEGTKIINVPKSIELKAHVALKNTMVVVIEQMYNLTSNNINYFSTGQIWSKLFYYGVAEQNNQFFKKLFAELLFKGRGDLDQEINAAIKNGAYTTPLNYTKKNIEQFNTDGDAIRYFVANDRPSACRFMYILKNAPADIVNKKAFGGYFSNKNRLLVKHNEMPNPCLAGGARNISKRSTKRYVMKTNKKTRKNK
jgi:hypothetical protein